MTTFRGTVKVGQLVFPAEVAEQPGLHKGDAVGVHQAALTPALSGGGENLFLTGSACCLLSKKAWTRCALPVSCATRTRTGT